ncbi:MAG: hypothetical protein QW776_02130 [Candidatus Nitrosocaldus sp.]
MKSREGIIAQTKERLTLLELLGIPSIDVGERVYIGRVEQRY